MAVWVGGNILYGYEVQQLFNNFERRFLSYVTRCCFFVIIYKSRFNWNETIYSTMCGLKFVKLYNGATLNY